MGVRLIHDVEHQEAALYDSVTETAFGPVITPEGDVDEKEMAQKLLKRLSKDARLYTDDELHTELTKLRMELEKTPEVATQED